MLVSLQEGHIFGKFTIAALGTVYKIASFGKVLNIIPWESSDYLPRVELSNFNNLSSAVID